MIASGVVHLVAIGAIYITSKRKNVQFTKTSITAQQSLQMFQGKSSTNVEVDLHWDTTFSLKKASPAALHTSVKPTTTAPHEHSGSAYSRGESASVSGSQLGLKVIYPRLSRLNKEQGTVQVEVSTHDNGLSYHIRVLPSNHGFFRLETAAKKTVEQALQNNQIPLEMWRHRPLRISFVFKLK